MRNIVCTTYCNPFRNSNRSQRSPTLEVHRIARPKPACGMNTILAITLLFTWLARSPAFRSHLRTNRISLRSVMQSDSQERQLIDEKLSQWRKLNQMGKFSKGTMYEEDVDALDEVSRLLCPPESQHTHEPHNSAQAVGLLHNTQQSKDRLGESEASVSVSVVFDIARRLAALKAQAGVIDSVLLAAKHYALLCEVRDKKTWDTKLVEDILMGLSRIEFTGVNTGSGGTGIKPQSAAGKQITLRTSTAQLRSPQTSNGNGNGISKQQIASYDYYTRWLDEGHLTTSTSNVFLIEYVMSLYLHDAVTAAQHCRQDLLARGVISEHQLLPGQICASINSICSSRDAHRDVHADIIAVLGPLLQRLSMHSTAHLNMVIRTLGRYQQMPHIFALLRAMKGAGVHVNTETQEILTQCVVKTVSKAVKADCMSDLPPPDERIPEVVFVGRSNVGKSSLVNYLLNRKALASTSATPGHTRAFHFYSVNQPFASCIDSAKVPKIALGNNKTTAPVSAKGSHCKESEQRVPCITQQQLPPMFRLVDVPGLGYAGEGTDEGTMQSWQSLLSRYMSRREPLRVVFHLIDSRHGITPVDREMVAMACAAARERAERETPAFRYVFLLTKADKVENMRLSASLREVQRAVLGITSNSSAVPSLSASATVEGQLRSGSGGSDANVGVIVTSVVDRSGAEEVWELIHHAVAP